MRQVRWDRRGAERISRACATHVTKVGGFRLPFRPHWPPPLDVPLPFTIGARRPPAGLGDWSLVLPPP